MTLIRILLGLPVLVALASAQTNHATGRELLRELVELRTVDPGADISRASRLIAERMRAAGFPESDVTLAGPDEKSLSLVVRLRGTGTGKPVLFNSHLDVVEARREDWSFDPFKLTERDGFFYGRGTQDDKGCAAALVDAFLRLKKENYRGARDLILALTGGEEGEGSNGVEWLLANRRPLIDAEYSINVDSGGGTLRNGKPHTLEVITSEKMYHTLLLEVKNKGGHSSLPEKDNAIYRLAAALGKISQYEFPVHLLDTTRAYFQKRAGLEIGQIAADMRAVAANADAAAVRRLSETPFYNAILRTTCVATEISGGHAPNALPQEAKATVNCRLLPGDDPNEVEQTIRRLVDDPQVSLRPEQKAHATPASPLRPDVMRAFEGATQSLWPTATVIPVLETGGTDGRLLREAGIPTYGNTGLFLDEGDMRAHGKDERVRVESFDQGCEFLYRLAKLLSAG